MKDKGNLVNTIPKGFEIYENPNAQVFLRKIQPQIITEAEIAVVDTGMQQRSQVDRYLIDVKKDMISIFTPNENAAGISELLTSTAAMLGRNSQNIQQLLEQSLTYASDLRFVLVDQQQRFFQTERYCYLGAIDDWIKVGPVAPLQTLVETFVHHIGQDSFYNLH